MVGAWKNPKSLLCQKNCLQQRRFYWIIGASVEEITLQVNNDHGGIYERKNAFNFCG